MSDFAKTARSSRYSLLHARRQLPGRGRDDWCAHSVAQKQVSIVCVFGASRLEDILRRRISSRRKSWRPNVRDRGRLNNGNGRFTLRPLPVEAQFAPVYSTVSEDFDGDGKTDLLLAGNFSGVTPLYGPYDASDAYCFTALATEASRQSTWKKRCIIEGQVRRMRPLRDGNGNRLIAGARTMTSSRSCASIRRLLASASRREPLR